MTIDLDAARIVASGVGGVTLRADADHVLAAGDSMELAKAKEILGAPPGAASLLVMLRRVMFHWVLAAFRLPLRTAMPTPQLPPFWLPRNQRQPTHCSGPNSGR